MLRLGGGGCTPDTVPVVTSSVASRPTADGHSGRSTPNPTLVTAALVAVIVLWGIGPPVTKLISAPPLVGAFVRFWISVPIIWVLAYASGRRMSIDVLRRTAVAGVLFGTNMMFLFAALQHTSITVISVVQALTPGIVLVVAGPWLGERATLKHVVWTGLGIAGVVVVVLGGDPEVSGDGAGFVFAVISTFAFVGYYVINRRARTRTAIDPIQWMAGVTLFAALAVTPFALATASPSDFGQLGAADWTYLAFIAGIVGIVSHVLMSWVHAFVPASRSSPALLASNVVAISVAWPLHDEPVTWLQVVGGLIVLGSVALVLTQPTVVLESHTQSPETDEPPLPTV